MEQIKYGGTEIISKVKTGLDSALTLKVILIVLGLAIVILGFTADFLGFGSPDSFGVGQFMLVLFGICIFLIGLLRKKAMNFYRWLAIAFLNTLLLLGFLELIAIVVARSYQQVEHFKIQELPYYSKQDWAELYWKEARSAENYAYKPYVIWKHLPFVGKTINIDQNGVRKTPGSECRDNAFKIFAFGGSTMLGWGSPDWGTIPAYLQKGLEGKIEKPVCVLNLAEDAYVSTQSLIALILQLQAGHIPDAVVFYDGVNETIAAYESGLPVVHPTLAKIAAKFEERENPLLKWYRSSRQYQVFTRTFVSNIDIKQKNHKFSNNNHDENKFINNLHSLVTEAYLNNYKIVVTLAKQYDFKYFFFWQPLLGIGNKKLTPEEHNFRSKMDPVFSELAKRIYENIAKQEDEYDNLVYMAQVFDSKSRQLWIDEWGHVTPEGNRIVAEGMLAVLEKNFF